VTSENVDSAWIRRRSTFSITGNGGVRRLAVSVAMATVIAACSTSTTHLAKPFGTARLTDTLVDPNRSTPANGSVAAHPGRTLVTSVWYPTGDRGPLPLIVFAHGFGTPPDLDGYTTILQRWASEGFVVAAPLFPLTRTDAPGGPDLADYVNQPGDVSFVISRLLAASASGAGPLRGMINPAEIGVAGHSLGGVTTLGLVANTCCRDPRVKAAVVMSGDSIGFPGGRNDAQRAPPLLLVHGNADPVVPYVSSITAFNAASAPKALLTIEGGGHGSPVDPGGPAFATVVKVTTDFFDRYLRQQAEAGRRLAADGRSPATTLTLALTGGTPVTLATPPTVPSTLHAAVAPSQGLHDGQVVTVSWQGFRPGVSVNVLQCDRNPPTGPGDCDLQTAKLLLPDVTGSGSIGLTVRASIGATSTCGGPTPCVVVVNEGGSTTPKSSVILPVSFSGSAGALDQSSPSGTASARALSPSVSGWTPSP